MSGVQSCALPISGFSQAKLPTVTLVESRSDPANDPFVFWFSGGPGLFLYSLEFSIV